MRYYEIITEARRNPEQNPKVSTLEALGKYAERDDVFVSFTSDVGEISHINTQDMYLTGFGRGKNTSGSKLGINPKSEYNTPIGIYTYPIDHVIANKGKVAWASDAPFLYVVQSIKPLLDLNNYSETDFARDSEKLIDMGFTDTRDEGIKTTTHKTPAGWLWNWTRKSARAKTASWSKILRSLGYSGAIDRGSGLIHPNEKTQAVFFSIDAVKVLEAIPNRFGRRDGTFIKDIIKKGIIPSEEVQLAAVNQNGHSLFHITNAGIEPSNAVQLAAVQKDGCSIMNIENPSEQVQLAAVKQDGLAIYYIIEKGITPSEKIQLAAVNNRHDAIQYINNPSEAVKKAAGL